MKYCQNHLKYRLIKKELYCYRYNSKKGENKMSRMKKVDLNCDLGESFGNYKLGMDEQILPLITSANIACGFHASDPVVMSRTVKMAAESGVAAGAHPGYQDLVGFGRRNMNVAPAEVTDIVMYQIGALEAFCRANGIAMQHVKPHGAMYNMAEKDDKLAEAICRGIKAVNPELILLGPGSGKMVKAAKALGLKTAGEVFADRAYMEDGTLVPRSQEGAMITDEEEAVARVLEMVQKGTVTAITGKKIAVQADSICVHGDGQKALLFVQKIRSELEKAGVVIVPMKEVIVGES